MNNEVIYKIEKEDLILDYYFNNEKIASTNAGCITDILHKVNLYNEEYNTLIEQNKQMIDIAKHYEQLQKENKKQKEVIDRITSNIQNDIDGFITINNYGECNDILELLEIYLDILKEVSE